MKHKHWAPDVYLCKALADLASTQRHINTNEKSEKLAKKAAVVDHLGI